MRTQFLTAVSERRKPIFTKDDGDLVEVITSALEYFILNRPFQLHEYCIMPNHIHILYSELKPNLGFKNSFLSYTAKEIVKQNNDRDKGLQHDFIVNKSDRIHQIWRRHSKNILVTKKDHYFAIATYIQKNPESEYWKESFFNETQESRLKLTGRFWN